MRIVSLIALSMLLANCAAINRSNLPEYRDYIGKRAVTTKRLKIHYSEYRVYYHVRHHVLGDIVGEDKIFDYEGKVVRVLEKGAVFRITKAVEKRGMGDEYGIVFLCELEDDGLLFEYKVGESPGELSFESTVYTPNGRGFTFSNSRTPPWKLIKEPRN